MHLDPADDLGKTLRLDKGYPHNCNDKNFDEFGFERKDYGKEEVPLFIPFNSLLISDT